MNLKLNFLCFRGIHNSLPSFSAKLDFSQMKIDHIADSLLKLQIKIGVHLINVEQSQLLIPLLFKPKPYLIMPIIINEVKISYPFLPLPNRNCCWETSPAMTCSEMALLIYRLLLKSKRRRSRSKHNKDLLVSLQEVSIDYYVGR